LWQHNFCAISLLVFMPTNDSELQIQAQRQSLVSSIQRHWVLQIASQDADKKADWQKKTGGEWKKVSIVATITAI
jgi:hypothetical protein